MEDFMKRHDRALRYARIAMHYCSLEGASAGAWRDAVLEICRREGVPEPDDVQAWVSGGKVSDADITDWTRTFRVI
ncbi:hypothetical protein [Roseovarius indicus]|uniref:hypothetical protein n=1 Tax=Roseovarius indicus TaxID=540747 RepID=UPI0007DA28A6|nr:hypothetical protein [Roseovarius indicus]OAO05370.1 hypothetical protein A8B76_02705 [Roseovarius indicus]